MENNRQRKKLGEILAVEKFYKNNNLTFDESLIQEKLEEPADVVYNDKKYQIVNADFDFQKDIHIKKYSSAARNSEQVFNDFIVQPIDKKRKYGQSAIGHILLIDSKLSPPEGFINKELKKINNNEFNIGFDEIYLVMRDKNIKIFPL